MNENGEEQEAIDIKIGSQADDLIGLPIYYAFFDEVSFQRNQDIEKQKAKEFTIDERKNYDRLYGEKLDQAISKSSSKNPDADPEKRKHATGDI